MALFLFRGESKRKLVRNSAALQSPPVNFLARLRRRIHRLTAPAGPTREALSEVRVAASNLIAFLNENVGDTADWPIAIKVDDDGVADELCRRLNVISSALKGLDRGKLGNAEVYAVTIAGIKLDPYRILDAYEITHPAHQHAGKKLLRAGRSHKTLREDIAEIISTLRRWLEMIDEDSAAGR